MQFQLWSDLTQLIDSLEMLLTITPPYGQLLQGGVSTSSLEYGFHHTNAEFTENVQHLEWLVAFNGSFHLLQECCIHHFLHKQKTVEATNKSSQPHDTHTHCLILCMHIHMHANRPTLMTAPADTYVKNAASTLSILCGETLSQHLSESMRFMQCHQWHYTCYTTNSNNTAVVHSYTHIIELQTYFWWVIWGDM